MGIFQMSVANNFCDMPLPKYLDSKTVLIYRPHPVCPLVGIGTLPTPLSPASVPFPPEPEGGGAPRQRVRGWGSPNSDDWRIA